MDFSLPDNVEDSHYNVTQKKCSIYPCKFCGWKVPQRIILVIFLFAGMSICSTMNYITDITLAISRPSRKNAYNSTTYDRCNLFYYYSKRSFINTNNDPIILHTHKSKWKSNEAYFVACSFLFGYSMGHIPGFLLADKYGGKFLIILSIAAASCIHFIYPWLLYESRWYSVFIARLLQGLCVGPMFPIALSVFIKWAPKQETATLGSVIFAGYDFGITITRTYLMAYFEYTVKWKYVYYLQIVCIYIWLILFSIYCSTEPREHSHISKRELDYIEQSFEQETVLSKKVRSPPYFLIMKNIPVLIIMLAFAVNILCVGTYLYFMVRYMKIVIGIYPGSTTFFLTVTWAMLTVGSAGIGGICDRLVNKKLLKFENSRKLIIMFTGVVLAFCFVAMMFTKCNHAMFFFFMMTGGLMLGANSSMLRVNMLDFSRNYTGTVIGISEGAANIVGAMATYIVHNTIKGSKSSDEEQVFVRVFWGLFGCILITHLLLIPCSSCKEQPFNTHISKKEVLKQTPTYPARY